MCLAALVVVAAALLGACVGDPDSGDAPADDGTALNWEAIRAAPPWAPAEDVLALGDTQWVRHDGAQPWDGGAHCTGALTAGAQQLGGYLARAFRSGITVQGYSCRPNTANAAETSIHGSGRALDIMIPMVHGRPNAAVGDRVAAWLIANAQAVGVQYIIWNRRAWLASDLFEKMRVYTGPNPHVDHVHAELNLDGAERTTPWFTGEPVAPSPCGDAAAAAAMTPWRCTRDGTAMQRCNNGAVATLACFYGCVRSGDAAPDGCAPYVAPPPCEDVAEGTATPWRCGADGATRERCAGTTLESVACAGGCASGACLE